MTDSERPAFDTRIFLAALVVLCVAYAAARVGFELTFDDSEVFTAESLAPEEPVPGEEARNDFFQLHPDDSAVLFLGSAAVLAALFALLRPDPRVFLTLLAALTLAQVVLRLGFAAVFGDASEVSQGLLEVMFSHTKTEGVGGAIFGLVLALIGGFAFAVLQTTVGFSIGWLSLPVYLLALALAYGLVAAAVARRAPGRSRLQVSLAAITACAIPSAYAAFRFQSPSLLILSGAVLAPIAWLAASWGASRATRNRERAPALS